MWQAWQARVEERAEPVGGERGRGRRHPVLAEDAVAQREPFLPGEGEVGGRVRQRVGVAGPRRGGGAARHLLEPFRRGEVGCRPRHLLHPRPVLRRQVVARVERRRGGGAEQEERERELRLHRRRLSQRPFAFSPRWTPALRPVAFVPPAARMSRQRDEGRAEPHSNTASGSSRLSEPSMVTPERSSAAITRSSERVCATSPSITACTAALPAALPSPIIWS